MKVMLAKTFVKNLLETRTDNNMFNVVSVCVKEGAHISYVSESARGAPVVTNSENER